jgi:hypothetical protein
MMIIGFFIFIVIIIVAEIFWIRQLVNLMTRSDNSFPGRYDKPVWVAILVICNLIGAIAYFIAKPREDKPLFVDVKPPVKDSPEPCLKCGKIIPPNTTICPSCGWSYQEKSEIK